MPEIEYVSVANHAEAINGLLYLQGAGWTDAQRMTAPTGEPLPMTFGIAVSVLVPWNETGQPFAFDLRLVSEDGGEPLLEAQAELQAERAPGMRPGTPIRTVLALNANVMFATPGGYEVQATVGESRKRSSFRVSDPAPLGGAPRGAGPAFPGPLGG